jgi:pimeloyl-ACP methyl ester carboxylesterase
MPTASANGIDLEYETFGTIDHPALLLIMGLGGPMIMWEEAFCRALADKGFFVIRYDNRDCGRSQKFDSEPLPDLAKTMGTWMQGGEIGGPYRLSDMAADGIGLLDALGVETAHAVGASMGGMIAQTLAIEYPSRVRSLTSIMSSTGDRALPNPSPEAMAVLMTPSAEVKNDFIKQHLASNRAVGADPAFFPYEEARLSARAERLWNYGIERDGSTRQMLSSLASGDRTPALKKLSLPSLVVHGTADTLFNLDHAEATACAIPGAQRLFIEGFGHDMHPAADETITSAIATLCSGAPLLAQSLA